MHNILKSIVEQKKKDLQSKANKKFKKAILDSKTIAIIGELKFSSPTSSHIGSKDILFTKAREYETAGINAISIITERHFFKGDTNFIPQVKQTVDLSILQKDFIIDRSQVYEAKFLGADALLLIARIIDEKTLQGLVSLAKNLGIEPVVEIASVADLKKAVKTETNIIAVNARDLDTFIINVEKACLLMEKIPQRFIRLGFSGITSASEIKQYRKAGAKGVLIGTSLMKAENLNDFIKSLKI